MTRIPVSSSNLSSVGYDPSSSVLEIAFNHGGIYQYTGVPQSVYTGLMQASSKGEYHHAHIKNSFPYRKIG
ncbi:KTSC domain-containing protein [Anaeromusa sp.]|uniref:KTSC domain-containing protein n=1 Tax=Anaeromusa sp. TaxID=1872520 RepID=UPI003A4C67D2